MRRVGNWPRNTFPAEWTSMFEVFRGVAVSLDTGRDQVFTFDGKQMLIGDIY